MPEFSFLLFLDLTFQALLRWKESLKAFKIVDHCRKKMAVCSNWKRQGVDREISSILHPFPSPERVFCLVCFSVDISGSEDGAAKVVLDDNTVGIPDNIRGHPGGGFLVAVPTLRDRGRQLEWTFAWPTIRALIWKVRQE